MEDRSMIVRRQYKKDSVGDKWSYTLIYTRYELMEIAKKLTGPIHHGVTRTIMTEKYGFKMIVGNNNKGYYL